MYVLNLFSRWNNRTPFHVTLIIIYRGSSLYEMYIEYARMGVMGSEKRNQKQCCYFCCWCCVSIKYYWTHKLLLLVFHMNDIMSRRRRLRWLDIAIQYIFHAHLNIKSIMNWTTSPPSKPSSEITMHYWL